MPPLALPDELHAMLQTRSSYNQHAHTHGHAHTRQNKKTWGGCRSVRLNLGSFAMAKKEAKIEEQSCH